MTIPPVTPSGPTSTQTSASENPINPVGLIPVDNLSAYSADIAAGKRMTIKEFGLAIATPTEQAKNVAFAAQQYNANSRNEFYKALMGSSTVLIGTLSEITAIAELYTSAYNQNVAYIDDENTYIAAYNTENTDTQTAVNTLNQAIANYNSGAITLEQLNNAVDTYNNYVSMRNSATEAMNERIANSNNAILGPNNQIEVANDLLQLSSGTRIFSTQDPYNSTALLMPTMPTVTDLPPISTVSFTPQTLSSWANSMNPQNGDTANLVTSLFKPTVDAYAINISILKQQSAYQGYLLYFLQGRFPFLPPAFLTENPKASLGNGGGVTGSGSGVASSVTVAALNDPLFSGIIEQSMFKMETLLYQMNVNPLTIAKLRFFTERFLGQIGVLAGARAGHLLGSDINRLDPQSKAANLVVALALNDEINYAIQNGVISQGVGEILSQAYPNLSANSLNTLTQQLSSAAELFILQAGVFQLSQALGNPQLLAQLLNTIPKALELGILNPFSPSLTANDENTAALQNALSESLVSQYSLSQSRAQEIVNSSINQVNPNAFFSGAVDQQTLTNAFVQNGLEARAAVNLTNYSQAFLQAEIVGKTILNNQVSSDLLSKDVLANQLISGIIQDNPNITGRQLRDQLSDLFISNGATKSQAILAATVALVGNNSGFTPLSLNDLSSNIFNTAIQQLSGITNARTLATELVSTVLGQNLPGTQTSLRTQIDDRLNTLIQSNDKTVTEEVKESFRAFLAPTLELYVFADQLRDPGKTFIGVMYGQTELPSNGMNQFNNEVQFQV